MNSYTDEQKATAVADYIEHGTTEAAKRAGASYRSVIRWAHEAGVVSQARREKTAEARIALADEYETGRAALRVQALKVAVEVLNRVYEPHKDFRGKDADEVWWDVAPSGDVKNYVTSFAILVDKMRLEEGKATERTETLTRDVVTAEIARLEAELASND